MVLPYSWALLRRCSLVQIFFPSRHQSKLIINHPSISKLSRWDSFIVHHLLKIVANISVSGFFLLTNIYKGFKAKCFKTIKPREVEIQYTENHFKPSELGTFWGKSLPLDQLTILFFGTLLQIHFNSIGFPITPYWKTSKNTLRRAKADINQSIFNGIVRKQLNQSNQDRSPTSLTGPKVVINY